MHYKRRCNIELRDYISENLDLNGENEKNNIDGYHSGPFPNVL